MLDAVTGLKMEGSTVLCLNRETQDWECAPTTLIPQIEELLRRLENFEYPEATVRESIILEKEHDIGTGLVRSFKDEDGDLTVTYQSVSKPGIEINEDAAFGLGSANESEASFAGRDAGRWRAIRSGSVPGKLAEALNSASDSGPASLVGRRAEGFGIAEALEDLKAFEENTKKRWRSCEGVLDTRFEELSAGATAPRVPSKRAARKSVSSQDAAEPACRFQKRPPRNRCGPLSVLIERVKRTFMMAGHPRGPMALNGRRKEERDQVSFISKRHRLKNPSGDAGLFISMLKSNRKNGAKNTLEENFYLERRVSEGEAEGEPKQGTWVP